jgi:alcohol dehydrogenase
MDAILRVKATSLNGFDPMILAGSTGLKTPRPMIPCGDIAGEIAELGAEVAGGEWKIGHRVCPHPFVPGEGTTARSIQELIDRQVVGKVVITPTSALRAP